MYLLEGPELRMHYWEDREEKKKAQDPAGFEPTTYTVMRHALYRCAKTIAQTLTLNNKLYERDILDTLN